MPFGHTNIPRNPSAAARDRRIGQNTIGSANLPMDVTLYGSQEFRIIRADSTTPLFQTHTYAGGGSMESNGFLEFPKGNGILLSKEPTFVGCVAGVYFDSVYGGLIIDSDINNVGTWKTRFSGDAWFETNRYLYFGNVLANWIVSDGATLNIQGPTSFAGEVEFTGNLVITSGDSIIFENASGFNAASLTYSATAGLVIDPDLLGSVNLRIQGSVKLGDNEGVRFGTGTNDTNYDATIYYNGTNLIIDPNVLGTGVVSVDGGLTISGTLTAGDANINGLATFIDTAKFNDGAYIGLGSGTLSTNYDSYFVYDGTDLVVVPDNIGTGYFRVDGKMAVVDQLDLADNVPIQLGTGFDASIKYDGTDLVIDPNEVGVGVLKVAGNAQFPDSNKLLFGTGKDVECYYDGTDMKVVTDAVAASDLVLDCGTQKTLELAEVVYDDMRIIPSAFDFPGVSDPVIGDWQPGGSGTTFKVWCFDQSDSGYFTVQIPHSYKTGEDIKVHMHWTPRNRGTTEGTATVAWKLDYSWANVNGTFGASAVVDCTDACQSTNHQHLMTPDVAISGSSKSISSMLVCRVFRDTGDTWAGTGAANAPALLEVDFHFPIDTIGSRDWGAK